MRIALNVLSKDRPTEIFGLICSLFTQTEQRYDLYILDDASGTPLTNYSFLVTAFERLKNTGHDVQVLRNDRSRGISHARQKLVEWTLENTESEYICRLDDDTLLDPEYLERLLNVTKMGYDIASGITPPLAAPVWKRDVNFVSPIINRVMLDKDGSFMINADDCGHIYLQGAVLPTHHFRSCALIKREVHEKVSYEDVITPCGFREEEFFSFRAILAGFSLGVDTGAIAWHLCTPSGGDRRSNYAELSNENQRLLNRFTKKEFKKHGNFLEAYEKRLIEKGLLRESTDEEKFATIEKNTNLIYNKDE